MISGYLFNPGEGERKYVIAGDELRVPDKDTDYFRVYCNFPGEVGELVYSISRYAVRDVRGVTDDEIEQLAQQDEAEQDQALALLSTALDHIEQVIGPWRATGCNFIDGAIFESGITACMTHSRPGSKQGACAVAEAIAFVDAHRGEE